MAVYKDKQRGTWYVSVYYTNWKGESDRKVKRGFKTRKDAVAWENTFLNKNAGDLNMTFADVTLWKHLQEIDEQAENMFNQLVKEICEDEGIDEELKEKDRICWVRSMNNVYNHATELVNHELIYT